MDHVTPVDAVKGRAAVRRVAAALAVVAASLVVASAMHLSGHVHGRAEPPFDAGDAGIAEAVIAAVLVAGVFGMLRSQPRGRTAGLITTGFATVGFLVGLSITARGGHWPDIAYHLVVLPILVGSLVVLARVGNERREARRSRGGPE
ncbi:hypothetical protein HC031_02375 [Planosporangium thailandense]|uniref:Integral membrane protein n=1 Tax=Planosporangium thailandense TaxID=765197 RepID=A0ABX0XTF7_9ACTN|nr:hypothetical protein [Planosporangium thailandense]NJC68574.1 hypothetical protein [Planosporangium thailandense]